MREAVRTIDPTLAFIRFETMTTLIRRDLDMQRLLTVLLGAFAASAVLLAAVGLYGLIAYAAARRRHEIGVRMALGATAWRVVRSFVGEGATLALIGLLLGLTGAAALTRLLAARLFGVTPLDPTTFVVAGVTLLAVAACASVIPASNAARTDPMLALRGE